MTAVYIIGRYVATVKLTDKFRTMPLLITFFLSISVIVLLDYFQQRLGITDYLAASYLVDKFDGDNSLFILIASSCLFLIFSRAHFYNQTINQVAKSVFAIYVMEWFARPFLLQYMDIPNINILIQPIATIGFTILVFLICTAIDQLRMLTTSRLENSFEALELHLFNKAKGYTERILQRCP